MEEEGVGLILIIAFCVFLIFRTLEKWTTWKSPLRKIISQTFISGFHVCGVRLFTSLRQLYHTFSGRMKGLFGLVCWWRGHGVFHRWKENDLPNLHVNLPGCSLGVLFWKKKSRMPTKKPQPFRCFEACCGSCQWLSCTGPGTGESWYVCTSLNGESLFHQKLNGTLPTDP